jgi:FKBP-type peptidyl-prolyl cis-trans isomerase FkpA
VAGVSSTWPGRLVAEASTAPGQLSYAPPEPLFEGASPTVYTLALALAAQAALAADKPLSPKEVQQALYALGALLPQRTPLGALQLTPQELEVVLESFTRAALLRPEARPARPGGPLLDQLLKEREAARAAAVRSAGDAYLARVAARPGVVKLLSGALYEELQPGEGRRPVGDDHVKVHYRGTLADGTEFDSSHARNEPAQLALDAVIRCWREGLSRLRQGGRARLTCPPEAAYGAQGTPTIPPNSVLVFEVELLSVARPGEPFP